MKKYKKSMLMCVCVAVIVAAIALPACSAFDFRRTAPRDVNRLFEPYRSFTLAESGLNAFPEKTLLDGMTSFYRVRDENGLQGVFAAASNELIVPPTKEIFHATVRDTGMRKLLQIQYPQDTVNRYDYYLSDGNKLVSLETSESGGFSITESVYGIHWDEDQYKITDYQITFYSLVQTAKCYLRESKGGVSVIDEAAAKTSADEERENGYIYGLDGYIVASETLTDAIRYTVSRKTELAAVFYVPAEAQILAVSDGHLLWQRAVLVADNEKKYDFIRAIGTETQKYRLETVSVNLKNGKTKKIKLDCAAQSKTKDLYDSDAKTMGSIWMGQRYRNGAPEGAPQRLIVNGKGETQSLDNTILNIADDLRPIAKGLFLAVGKGIAIADKSLKVVYYDPELEFVSVDCATKRIYAAKYSGTSGLRNFGAIDFEGNVTLPFDYRVPERSDLKNKYLLLFNQKIGAYQRYDAMQCAMSDIPDLSAGNKVNYDFAYANTPGIITVSSDTANGYREVTLYSIENWQPIAVYETNDPAIYPTPMDNGNYLIKYRGRLVGDQAAFSDRYLFAKASRTQTIVD